MFQKFTFLLFFVILAFESHCQIRDTAITKQINLPTSRNFKTTNYIVVYETDTFKIYSSFNSVINSIKNWIGKNDIDWDNDLLASLLDTTKTVAKRLEYIHANSLLNSRLNFRISELLQKKKCWVYNKVLNSFEVKLFVTKYVKNWWTGIRFSTQANQVIMDLETGAF